jgi:hypothetical protein
MIAPIIKVNIIRELGTTVAETYFSTLMMEAIRSSESESWK